MKSFFKSLKGITEDSTANKNEKKTDIIEDLDRISRNDKENMRNVNTAKSNPRTPVKSENFVEISLDEASICSPGLGTPKFFVNPQLADRYRVEKVIHK